MEYCEWDFVKILKSAGPGYKGFLFNKPGAIVKKKLDHKTWGIYLCCARRYRFKHVQALHSYISLELAKMPGLVRFVVSIRLAAKSPKWEF